MADTERDRMEAEGAWIDWRGVFARRKTLIATVTVAAVLGAYATVQWVLPELYEARASVLVKLGRENTDVPATVQKGAVLTGGVRKEELNSEAQLLESRSLITEVVDRLGPGRFRVPPALAETALRRLTQRIGEAVQWMRARVDDFLIAARLKQALSDRDKLILAIEGALKVDVERESDVINARLRLPDPDLATDALISLLERYVDHHIRVRQNVEVKGFFGEQVDKWRDEVRRLEAAQEAVKGRLDLTALGEQRTLVLRQIDAVRAEMDTSQARRAALQAQAETLGARLAAMPDEVRQSQTVAPNPVVQTRKERLNVLEQERARLLTLYTPDSPPVRNVEAQIAALTELLAREPETLVGAMTTQANPLKAMLRQNLEEAGVQLSGLQSTIAELRTRLATLDARLREMNDGEQVLTELDREHRLAEESYLAYRRRMEEGRMSEELDRRRVANITLLSAPVRPIQPVFPPKLAIVMASPLVGLVIGTALALLLEYTSDVIRSPRDVMAIPGAVYLGTYRG